MKAEQKVIYKKESEESTLPVPVLPPQDRKIYRIENREEVFEYAIRRLNPNFWYVFGHKKTHRDIFGMYLNEHHPELKNLFLRAVLEDPPDYFNLKDTELKGVLLTKFHNNQNYGIFDIDRGKIKVRRMNNREAVRKLRAILIDIQGIYEGKKKSRLRLFKKEAQSLMRKLNKIQTNLESLEEAYKEQALTEVHPDDPERFLKLVKRKELEEKLYYAPLWI
jgi:hypothetical protein